MLKYFYSSKSIKHKIMDIISNILIYIILVVLISIPAQLLSANIYELVIYGISVNAKNVANLTSIGISDEITMNAKSNSYAIYEINNHIVTFNEITKTKLQTFTEYLRNETEVDSINVLCKINNTQVLCVADTSVTYSKEGITTPNPSEIGLEKDMNSLMLEAFTTKSVIVGELPNKDNNIIAAYAPITDNNTGTILAITNVNYSTNHIATLIHTIKLILIYFVLLLSLILLVIIRRLMLLHNNLNREHLTGLFTRAYQRKIIHTLIASTRKQHNNTFTLIMLDIDNFKGINDTYGHLIGDKVLKTLAQIMQFNIQQNDICSRYGGDEFSILLVDTTKEQAYLIAERIRTSIETTILTSLDGSNINITISMGIAEWQTKMSTDDLYQNADKALYVSKKLGKNKVSIYDTMIT